MGAIVPQVLILTSAIRQGFEMDQNPGNTVQGASQNPGQVHLNGFFSVERIAERAWEALKQYHEATKPKDEVPAAVVSEEERMVPGPSATQ